MSAFKARYRQLAMDSRQEREVSFAGLLWLFIMGSLMGFLLEGMFHLIRQGSWAFRVGTLWGPFCVLYGFGAVVMYLMVLVIRGRRPAVQFCLFALTGSAVELLAGVFQKLVFGTESWNYSAHPLNLGGYVSLKMTLLWGVAGMALMYLVLPLLFGVFNRFRLGERTLLCRAAAVFMAVNLLWTGIALLRWQERMVSHSPAGNAVESWMDHRWPDEKMQQRFPNMEFVSTEQ